jgi:hypothetical protein
MPLAPLLFLAATLTVACAGANRMATGLLLWLIVLTVPFLLHFLSSAGMMPLRSMQTLAYVTWLMGMLTISHERMVLRMPAMIVLTLFLLQMTSLTSQYIASATITQEYDRLLAADIYRRVGERSDGLKADEEFKLDVYGQRNISTIYAKGQHSTTQSSFFGWEGGQMVRMMAYMKVMGYPNVSMLDDAQRRVLTPLFSGMPVWPAAGAVKRVAAGYLVKLSELPDAVHDTAKVPD